MSSAKKPTSQSYFFRFYNNKKIMPQSVAISRCATCYCLMHTRRTTDPNTCCLLCICFMLFAPILSPLALLARKTEQFCKLCNLIASLEKLQGKAEKLGRKSNTRRAKIARIRQEEEQAQRPGMLANWRAGLETRLDERDNAKMQELQQRIQLAKSLIAKVITGMPPAQQQLLPPHYFTIAELPLLSMMTIPAPPPTFAGNLPPGVMMEIVMDQPAAMQEPPPAYQSIYPEMIAAKK